MNSYSCSRNNGKIVSDPLFVDSSGQADYYIRLKLNPSLFCIPISLSWKQMNKQTNQTKNPFISLNLSLRVGVYRFVLSFFQPFLLFSQLSWRTGEQQKHIRSSLKCWPICYTHTHTEMNTHPLLSVCLFIERERESTCSLHAVP